MSIQVNQDLENFVLFEINLGKVFEKYILITQLCVMQNNKYKTMLV